MTDTRTLRDPVTGIALQMIQQWDDHGALAWRTHEDVAVRVPFNVRLGRVICMGTPLDGFYPARVSSGRERLGE